MELVFRGDRHATRGSDGAVTGDLGGARGVDWEHRAVLVPATFAAGRARLPGIAASTCGGDEEVGKRGSGGCR